MILLIDNFDSFSYNLYQYIGSIEPDIRVVRNNELTVDEIAALAPERIVISPGPGKPSDAGICEPLIKELFDFCPILGVCLGHQAICEAFGARVGHAKALMHGKQSIAHIDTESALFKGLPEAIQVARYHSLSATAETMPECLRVTAKTGDGEIMAAEHIEYPVYGLQFHPESILTPDGMKIIENFIKIDHQ